MKNIKATPGNQRTRLDHDAPTNKLRQLAHNTCTKRISFYHWYHTHKHNTGDFHLHGQQWATTGHAYIATCKQNWQPGNGTFSKRDQNLWWPHPQFKTQKRFITSNVTQDNSYNMTRQQTPSYMHHMVLSWDHTQQKHHRRLKTSTGNTWQP